MSKERNEFLESDGLYWESPTHEWFNDKTSTRYAQKKSVLSGSGVQKDSLPMMMCFVVRGKESGEYNRLMLNKETNEIEYETKSLEDMGYHIDKLKVIKHFKYFK
jgi:hypothetical protein